MRNPLIALRTKGSIAFMDLHKDQSLHAYKMNTPVVLDRVHYWESLRQLSLIEAEDYLRVYDAIAASKAITEGVRLLVDSDILSHRVYGLAHELVVLIEQMTLARQHGALEHFRQLHGALDEINIAVNAWSNRICLKHGSFLYGQYRQLMNGARAIHSN
jgi:hypothetical protein